MRSLKASYESVRGQLKYEYSSYICFARAIRGKNFSRKSISKWFDVLVEKDDYDLNDRKSLVEFLQKLSETPVEVDF